MVPCASPQHDLNFQAALGWLHLGNPAEASATLAQVAPQFLDGPDVAGLRWATRIMAKDWTQALKSADRLIRLCPDRPIGWLARAVILQELSRRKLAWDTLMDASRRFPTSSIVAFNLASLAGAMHRMQSARRWLNRAVRFGQRKAILHMAFEDPNLRLLRDEIRLMLKTAKSSKKSSSRPKSHPALPPFFPLAFLIRPFH